MKPRFTKRNPVSQQPAGVVDLTGRNLVSVWPSRAVGRLLPEDVIGMIRLRSRPRSGGHRMSTPTAGVARADVNFYFDPVCPFAWITSKWLRMVTAQRNYTTEWKFISLRLINAEVDYDTHFPAGYEDGHTAGLRLLRVATRTRAEHGVEAVGRLYEAMGTRIFDTNHQGETVDQGSTEFVNPILAQLGLPAELADASAGSLRSEP